MITPLISTGALQYIYLLESAKRYPLKTKIFIMLVFSIVGNKHLMAYMEEI